MVRGVVMMYDLQPYPAMKDSGVPWLGELPEQWAMQRMKTILRERSQKGFPNESLLAATQTKGVVRKEEYENRTVLALKDLHLLKLVDIGDFVISLRSFQGGIEYARERGIISPAYTILYPKDKRNHGYLAYLFKSKPFVENLGLYVTGIRQGQNIDYEKLSRSGLPLPPIAEQEAIVCYLDYIDRRIRRYINAKQKLIKLLEEQKQAIIHQAVTRGLDPDVKMKPSGVEWLGEVPEHWHRSRLKSLVGTIDRRSTTGAETLLSLRRDHGIVVYAEHFSRPPQGATTVGFKLVEIGQIVVNRLQANNGLIFCSGLQGLVSPDYSVLEARADVNMNYLAMLLRTAPYQAHFRREATGLGTGTSGFLRLYDDKLLETVVVLPPVEEQGQLLKSIGEQMASLNNVIAKQHKELDLLREYRTRLIADVVTGKVDVRGVAAELPQELETEEEIQEEADEMLMEEAMEVEEEG